MAQSRLPLTKTCTGKKVFQSPLLTPCCSADSGRDGAAARGQGRAMEGEYQGRVKDGKLHGVGVCLYTDGSRYQGDWKAGLKSGRGTHSFASGDQFEGEWENGWMHGLGVYTWKIGDKYIGEVRAALRHLMGPPRIAAQLAQPCGPQPAAAWRQVQHAPAARVHAALAHAPQRGPEAQHAV